MSSTSHGSSPLRRRADICVKRDLCQKRPMSKETYIEYITQKFAAEEKD
jgi:hypothetical protein